MKQLRSNQTPLRHAFTLLEMMVVLLIIALIIGSVAVVMSGVEDTANVTTTKARINGIATSLTSYKVSNLTYPTQEQGLDALVSRPTAPPQPKHWKQQAKPDAILDPWGRKLVYKNPGKQNPGSYDVYSLGQDGLDGTGDEIGNW